VIFVPLLLAGGIAAIQFEDARTPGRDLGPKPAVRFSLESMVRPSQELGPAFAGDVLRSFGDLRGTLASIVPHAHVAWGTGWSISMSAPLGAGRTGAVFGNLRLGGGWGRQVEPDSQGRSLGFGLGTDVYLPTATPSSSAQPGTPIPTATLHAYEPHSYFDDNLFVRGRAHGTARLGDFRFDAEAAFTGGIPVGQRARPSVWYNYFVEVGYRGMGAFRPFIGTVGTVRLNDLGSHVGSSGSDVASAPLMDTIPPRLNLGTTLAIGPMRLRLLGQVVFIEEAVGVDAGDRRGGPASASTPRPDDRDTDPHVRFGVELGFVLPAISG